DGSCTIQFGETMVLCTATAQDNPTNLPFFPLTVEYRERTYAAGKIERKVRGLIVPGEKTPDDRVGIPLPLTIALIERTGVKGAGPCTEPPAFRKYGRPCVPFTHVLGVVTHSRTSAYDTAA